MSENETSIETLEAVLQLRKEGLDSHPEVIREHKIRVYEGFVSELKKQYPQLKLKSYSQQEI